MVCTAAYDYVGPDEGDLSFHVGDRVTLVEEIQSGWWTGKLDDGSFGLLPETYITPEKPTEEE